MSTSGTTTFNLVRNQIIEEAFKEIGVLTPNRSLTNEEMNDGALKLNLFCKSLISKGSFLWKTQQAILFLEPGQEVYVIDGSTSNCTEVHSETELSADAIAGATSIVVDDVTGFVIGYFIGITQSDSTLLWTTITNIVGTTITLDDPLVTDATEGAIVFAYQTKIGRPERIQNAQARIMSDIGSNQDIPMVQLSRDTYFNIPVKNTSARPNQFYYDKQLSSGIIYLWPIPDSSTNMIVLTFIKQIYDFDAANDDPDFPVEWLQALILNVAYRLSRSYGRFDPNEREQLKRDAEQALADAEGYDREPTSIYFQPATNININNYR